MKVCVETEKQGVNKMKKALVNIKNNYQLYIAALTIVAITTCFVVGQLQQKAQAQKVAIEKTR